MRNQLILIILFCVPIVYAWEGEVSASCETGTISSSNWMKGGAINMSTDYWKVRCDFYDAWCNVTAFAPKIQLWNVSGSILASQNETFGFCIDVHNQNTTEWVSTGCGNFTLPNLYGAKLKVNMSPTFLMEEDGTQLIFSISNKTTADIAWQQCNLGDGTPPTDWSNFCRNDSLAFPWYKCYGSSLLNGGVGDKTNYTNETIKPKPFYTIYFNDTVSGTGGGGETQESSNDPGGSAGFVDDVKTFMELLKGGGSVKEVLQAWNPSRYKQVESIVIQIKTATDPREFAKLTTTLLIAIFKYIVREPAALAPSELYSVSPQV